MPNENEAQAPPLIDVLYRLLWAVQDAIDELHRAPAEPAVERERPASYRDLDALVDDNGRRH